MGVFEFLIALVVVSLGFVWLMASMFVSRRERNYNPEATELMQSLNRSLAQMERRIETLETLLIEKAELNEPPTYREVMEREQSHR